MLIYSPENGRGERNIRYVAADAGYTALNRVKKFADKGVLLLTPVNGVKSNEAIDYLDAINTSEPFASYQKQRQTVIELVFSLLIEGAATDVNQKQLPVSRIENVRPFLILTVKLLQLAMLVNAIYRT